MWLQCNCVACNVPFEGTLPTPALFTLHTQGPQCVWVWLTRARDGPLEVQLAVPSRGMPMRFGSMREAVLQAARDLSVPTTNVEADAIAASAFVRPTDASQCIRVEDLGQIEGEGPFPEDGGSSPLCTWLYPTTTMTTSRASSSSSSRKRNRPAVAPPASDSEEEEEKGEGHEEDARRAYDVTTLGGGDPREVLRLATLRPCWDEEIVGLVMRWGAFPPLHRIHRVVETRFRNAQCTFVEPSGRLVKNVWVPVGSLKIFYPQQTAHL